VKGLDTPLNINSSAAYTGIWYHGDYVYINRNTGGVVILGRR
jgi:acyl-coenzyme A synthetase/AMP-(fatty) acid ligase